MLVQEQLIARARELAQRDERVDGLLLYGSFAAGEGDEHSDVDLYVYVDDQAFDSFDEGLWLRELATVELSYRNEYGITTVIFEGSIRGEFHFEPTSSIPRLAQMMPGTWLTSTQNCVLYDPTGALTETLTDFLDVLPDRSSAASMEFLASSVTNWLLMVDNLRRRGEHARALDFLHRQVHPHLLRLVRVAEDTTGNWLSPARRLEDDISPSSYQRFQACTTSLDPIGLANAVHHTWQWFLQLRQHLEVPVPNDELIRELDDRLGAEQVT